MTEPTETDRLHDKILTLEAELAHLRDLLRTENQRANAAIDREETAEQAALEAQQECDRLLAVSAGVAPATDQAALRDRIAEAIRRAPSKDLRADWNAPNGPLQITARVNDLADAVLAVLPAPADRADDEAHLSPDYQHPECGFRWHGRDGMDIPMRDGQPVCPRCELAVAEKLLRHAEKRCDELRTESKRRGKIKLEQAEQIRRLEKKLDEVRTQLGAEILRAGQAESELRRVAAESAPADTGHGDSEGEATAAELAHAIDNATPYPIELDRQLCDFMAARLLEMLAIHKRPEHPVWQPEEEPEPGEQPQPEDPATFSADRLRCPRCREDITDYAEDDHVFRTGDGRPYCSGECVIAAHRAGLPTAAEQPAAAQQPKEA